MAEGTRINILRCGTFVRERLGSTQTSARYAHRHFVGFRAYPTELDAPLRRNKAPLDRQPLSQQTYVVHCIVSKSLLLLFRSKLYKQKTRFTRFEAHIPVMSGLSGSVAKVYDLYSVDTRFQSH